MVTQRKLLMMCMAHHVWSLAPNRRLTSSRQRPESHVLEKIAFKEASGSLSSAYDHGRMTAVSDHSTLDDLADHVHNFPTGIPGDFKIIHRYDLPANFYLDALKASLEDTHVQRLNLTAHNVSLPVALMMADSISYPSLSRARKACRNGQILIRRKVDKDGTTDERGSQSGLKTYLSANAGDATDDVMVVGRVGDRVVPGNLLFRQTRISNGSFPAMRFVRPAFDMPVIYEDDHFALVNKPAGVVVYNPANGGHGAVTVRAALPYCLQASRSGTVSVLRRPASVHRLDKSTSGLLCVAKTKPAMNSLSRQFHDRVVQKTYAAIVNGLLLDDGDNAVAVDRARDLGVDVNDAESWQLIDAPLDGRHAVTLWRALSYTKSLHAYDNILTLVELKPKTGRYHQLRRHIAGVHDRPLVGDNVYDNNTPTARKFRDRGLMLCATGITLEHPYFNSIAGKQEWQALGESEKQGSDMLWEKSDGTVMITARVPLPSKFEVVLRREGERYHKFAHITLNDLC